MRGRRRPSIGSWLPMLSCMAWAVPAFRRSWGPSAFKPVFHRFREALGDLAIDIERVFVDGEYCTVHCRVKGRHVGRPLGGEPTGRPVSSLITW